MRKDEISRWLPKGKTIKDEQKKNAKSQSIAVYEFAYETNRQTCIL